MEPVHGLGSKLRHAAAATANKERHQRATAEPDQRA